eukprot:CAMPEP_0174252262 /NCGR_PEP_ID=MMETSP0439-20130205/1801_1 /TAXON_ID=0 /ORGANISM="Stereomyxa ramosa, Strain Chinc5" /LENGTH=1190 /DNA_ID=CAMNT_0015332775 /DNA_START=101 /DNA_END=3673 /DNA_ORIENTATION=+
MKRPREEQDGLVSDKPTKQQRIVQPESGAAVADPINPTIHKPQRWLEMHGVPYTTGSTYITQPVANTTPFTQNTIPVSAVNIVNNASTVPDINAAQRSASQVKFENALEFLDQVKIQFQSEPEIYTQFLEVMKDFKAQAIDTPGVIARVKELFKGHEGLVGGFNTFLPPGYKIEPPDEEPATRKQPELTRARGYVKKIKERFQNSPQIYRSFLEILHAFHREQHGIRDVYEQVSELFKDHTDLLEEFSQFLPDTSPAQAGTTKKSGRAKRTKGTNKGHQKQLSTRKATKSKGSFVDRDIKELNFFYKVKKRLGDDRLYDEFLKCLNLFSMKVVTRVELIRIVKDVLGSFPDLMERFKRFIGYSDEDELAGKDSDSESAEQWSMSDIDFSACQRCGPSYRALPKGYQQPSHKNWAGVLNDKFVSVPTGSEDFGFKGTRKNEYEEVLFKCEDDRYELDLVIELNASTLRALEAILKKISELTEEEAAVFQLDTPLAVLHIRSIERIYGTKGPDVVEKLFTNPVVAVPVILKRLKQKDLEWRNARREWNKIWREVNEKNYHRSLDHRSFSFKQNDKKNLSAKTLLAEIKQKYQEKVRESPSSKTYHLKYLMEDNCVLSDVCDLITYSAERTLNKADREKLDSFMEHFLKQFFVMDSPTVSSEMDVEEAKTNSEKDKEAETVVKPMDVENEVSTDNAKPTDASADANGEKDKSEETESPDKTKMDVEDQQEKATSDTAVTNEENTQETTKTQAKDVEPLTPVTKKKQTSSNSKIFFGNTSFYTFFRLYQILCHRLTRAKEMEKTSEKAKWGESVLSPPKLTKNIVKEPYQHLITSIYSLMEGSLEQPKFEDDCRNLFGISSYILFTIDKLISQIAKQLHTLISDETCAKLLALYTYESSRTGGFLETVYHSNVLELLGEEKCFRFEFNQETQEFEILLLDPTLKPRFLDLSFNKEQWSEYVENYVQSEASTLDVRKNQIFLLRSKKDASKTDMDNVIIQNNLECKICLSTYRLFYVEDTEDFLYRKCQLSKAKQMNNNTTVTRSKKFRKWLADQVDVGKVSASVFGDENEEENEKGKEKCEGSGMEISDAGDANMYIAEKDRSDATDTPNLTATDSSTSPSVLSSNQNPCAALGGVSNDNTTDGANSGGSVQDDDCPNSSNASDNKNNANASENKDDTNKEKQTDKIEKVPVVQ